MRKIFTFLVYAGSVSLISAQWEKVSPYGTISRKSDNSIYYNLNIDQLRDQLSHVQKTGRNAQGSTINVPTLDGKIERFTVYSFPVMDEELANKYQLGSYVGVGIDDPAKYIRFSVAPNDFQSMIIDGNGYQFVEPANQDKTLYSVHKKTQDTGGKSFICSTKENPRSINEIEEFTKIADSWNKNPLVSKSSDKKYRTLKLALSVTGEYTKFFGGTSQALTQMNATMTRVNGVFEKDFALHLNMINAPALIYTDPATDPYSSVTNPKAPPSAWNTELMNTLHSVVGDASFDIGHLFGASGGGGDAGCIGCVCSNTLALGSQGNATDTYKGAGITSPATGTVDPSTTYPPSGDNFDIDYVAHEMGHQLGANHTFSFYENTGVEAEPGSGSTIMGYAGITGTTTDVQAHSDAYFHGLSISQFQTNLASTTKTCDVETTVNNSTPVVNALISYTIPKSTAFVLTANATDADGDALTYCWEEVDAAASAIGDTGITNSTTNQLGTTKSGATFRSLTPTSSNSRYFPTLPTVLSGKVKDLSIWESTSSVARTTKFRVTVRDNNVNGPQTAYGTQTITVGSAAAFTSNTTSVNAGTPTTVTWTVSGTTASPYSVANVKIDYSSDNGATWTVIAASTANDGTESLTFPSSLAGKTIYIRISAINNVFYAVSKALVTGTLGALDIAKDNGIKIYPSPAKDILNISKVSNKANYIIYSISGQLISNGKINDNKVNVSHLSKGTYLISVSEGDNQLKTKFVKE